MMTRVFMTSLPFLRRERDQSLSHRRPLAVAGDEDNICRTGRISESREPSPASAAATASAGTAGGFLPGAVGLLWHGGEDHIWCPGPKQGGGDFGPGPRET